MAATGVGAGDLATAAFTGSRLGVAVLWAVVVGAFLKFLITEGLTRWQLVTGETLLEGVFLRLGRAPRTLFLVYFVLWSFFVGSALISACGVAAHAIAPVFSDASTGKLVFGIGASLLGASLVLAGGFALFERVMAVCVGIMFVTVIMTAALLGPDLPAIARGLLWPSIPALSADGLTWTVALMGGVGGTVTVLCYGYWIREEGRLTTADLSDCRIDLAVGYTATALFGLSMVVIGSTIEAPGRGAGLIVNLADSLVEPLGRAGRWVFLLGAFSAIFSSLLGVWQSVPYIFANVWRLLWSHPRGDTGKVDRSLPYRAFLFALATVPMLGLFVSFREVQKVYAVFGALFMPMLALALLVLNGRASWVHDHRNRPMTAAALVATVLLFLMFGALELRGRFG